MPTTFDQVILPTQEIMTTANIAKFMAKLNFQDCKTFHRYTVTHYQDFWQRIVKQLRIFFKKEPLSICDLSQGIEAPIWFPGATLNITDSCFTAPDSEVAILYEDANQNITQLSYTELNTLSNRIANGLIEHGFLPGDAIGIVMPMNFYAVAIYLGIIKMGGIVVSIADSFSSEEIAARLHIANTKALFTQELTGWNGKTNFLLEKILKSKKLFNQPLSLIVLSDELKEEKLTGNDRYWHQFLSQNEHFDSIACLPMQAANILFSSGTTGEPKAIVWNHTTPIKVASDAYFHQNIQPGDILTWPTNLGWMMGPWLIFAALMNHASIALYHETPIKRPFGEFVQKTKVTMLGVVPTIVAAWRKTQCMENLDWSAVKVFSSTGECSNPEDMYYLMSLAGFKPVIEYCGGTEIGGAYVSSTVIEPNYPSLFSTPTMGLDFVILNEAKQPAKIGEVAIIPPSIGLSTTLLNADHHKIYYENMPILADGRILRRHGDEIEQLSNGYYSLLGRSDDTMNLSGIKVSAVEIERAIGRIDHIMEVAAIAVSPENHGPSKLIIYAVTTEKLDKERVLDEMQSKLNQLMNPLFKIHDVIFISELPKTPSNKIMRRKLRDEFERH